MQLLEYFAWTYLNNKKINFITSNLKGVEKQYTLLLLFIMTIILQIINLGLKKKKMDI